MGAVPNIFLEQSPNRQAMSHITSEERGFVIYDQDLFDSTASSSVVITLYLSWMPSLRYSPRHIAAWCNSHFALFYFPAIPISYPKLTLPPPPKHTRLFKRWALSRTQNVHLSDHQWEIHSQRPPNIYPLYIHNIPLWFNWLCPAVDGLQGVKVHAGSYSHSSTVERAVTGSANRRRRG